jgi:hypothetical protein
MASPTPTSSWRTRIRRSHRIALGVGALAVVVLVLVFAQRAIQPAAFDRPLAIDRTIDASGGRLTHGQAACYVDKARAKVGPSYLEPGVSIPAAVGQRLTAIRDDCVGLAGLGTQTPTVSVPGTEAGNQPLRHGQDPALDTLWSRCAAGSGAACDELFDRSPVGSQYERFALTCGGRTPQMRCAAVYRRR